MSKLYNNIEEENQSITKDSFTTLILFEDKYKNIMKNAQKEIKDLVINKYYEKIISQNKELTNLKIENKKLKNYNCDLLKKLIDFENPISFNNYKKNNFYKNSSENFFNIYHTSSNNDSIPKKTEKTKLTKKNSMINKHQNYSYKVNLIKKKFLNCYNTINNTMTNMSYIDVSDNLIYNNNIDHNIDLFLNNFNKDKQKNKLKKKLYSKINFFSPTESNLNNYNSFSQKNIYNPIINNCNNNYNTINIKNSKKNFFNDNNLYIDINNNNHYKTKKNNCQYKKINNLSLPKINTNIQNKIENFMLNNKYNKNENLSNNNSNNNSLIKINLKEKRQNSYSINNENKLNQNKLNNNNTNKNLSIKIYGNYLSKSSLNAKKILNTLNNSARKGIKIRDLHNNALNQYVKKLNKKENLKC